MAVSPSTGKTHVRYCRFIIDGANLSGDMRTISSFGANYEQADATGWSNGTRQWLTGQGNVMLDGLTAVFSNAENATGPIYRGSHTKFSPTDAETYASVFIGVRAAPAVGNSTFSSPFQQSSYYVNGGVGGSDPVMVNASFFGSATIAMSSSLWGVALTDGVEISATTNYGSVDNGASSSGGYIAYLHITQTTGAVGSNTWAFKIEHSTNDSSWADLATFTLTGAALNVERLEGSGTVNRYVRFVATRTGGTASVWCSFIRK